MPLLNSGKEFAQQQLQLLGIEFKDSEGNIDQAQTDAAIDSLANVYNTLFQYMSDKLTNATIHTPGNVSGAHISGTYNGVTTGDCNIKIT